MGAVNIARYTGRVTLSVAANGTRGGGFAEALRRGGAHQRISAHVGGTKMRQAVCSWEIE
jgi:hypothetical protein